MFTEVLKKYWHGEKNGRGGIPPVPRPGPRPVILKVVQSLFMQSFFTLNHVVVALEFQKMPRTYLEKLSKRF